MIACVSWSASAVEDGGVVYYNFFDMTDQWYSDDTTNTGTAPSASYPSFGTSGDSSPTSALFGIEDSDVITTPTLTHMSSTQGIWTISYWANVTSFTGGKGIGYDGGAGKDYVQMPFTSTTDVAFFARDDSYSPPHIMSFEEGIGGTFSTNT